MKEMNNKLSTHAVQSLRENNYINANYITTFVGKHFKRLCKISNIVSCSVITKIKLILHVCTLAETTEITNRSD